MRLLVAALICGSFISAGRALSEAPLSMLATGPQPSAVPRNSERQMLAARVVLAFGLDRAARLGLEAAWQEQRNELTNKAKAAPPDRAKQIIAAYDSAVHEGQDIFLSELMPKLQESIVNSAVTDDDLLEFLGLYESSLGQRTLPPNQPSAEDRQALGKYMLDHPHVLNALPAVMAAVDTMKTYSVDHRHHLSVDVAQRLCEKLVRSRISTGPCPKD